MHETLSIGFWNKRMVTKAKPNKVRLTVKRPAIWKMISRFKGDIEVTVEVYDGRRRRFVAVEPNQVQVVDL